MCAVLVHLRQKRWAAGRSKPSLKVDFPVRIRDAAMDGRRWRRHRADARRDSSAGSEDDCRNAVPYSPSPGRSPKSRACVSSFTILRGCRISPFRMGASASTTTKPSILSERSSIKRLLPSRSRKRHINVPGHGDALDALDALSIMVTVSSPPPNPLSTQAVGVRLRLRRSNSMTCGFSLRRYRVRRIRSGRLERFVRPVWRVVTFQRASIIRTSSRSRAT